MTEEIDGYQEDLVYLLNTLEDGLQNLSQSKLSSRQYKIAGLEQVLASTVTMYASFNTSYRELESDLQPKYHPIGVAIKSRLSAIQASLRTHKIEDERNRLSLKDDQRTTQELLDEAMRVQAQSKASTATSKGVLEEMRITGMATNEQLQKDRSALEDVEMDLDELESDLDIASHQLKAIVRRLSRDNLIRGLCIIAGLVVLTALIVVISKRDQAGGGKDTT